MIFFLIFAGNEDVVFFHTSLVNKCLLICVNLSFQACKAGRVQHLEHLLFYGAEMNAQNSSGNTPLHVCAVNNQVICLMCFCLILKW